MYCVYIIFLLNLDNNPNFNGLVHKKTPFAPKTQYLYMVVACLESSHTL